MAATLKPGVRSWGGARDEEGYREFKVKHLVYTDDPNDGPYTVMECAGLPIPGVTMWQFGNDDDIFAICKHDMEIGIHQEREGDPNRWWAVVQTFTTKPLKRCQDEQIEDPVLQTPRISGTFARYTEEAVLDRFGLPIFTSSNEPIHGPLNEWDASRPTVRIQQNQTDLDYPTMSALVDHVNDAPLWGFARRCVKLSNFTWEESYYGLCYKYYAVSLDFDVNVKTFDREVVDEGTRLLNGYWHAETKRWVLRNIDGVEPNRYNPTHYVQAQDPQGNPTRMILNGEGRPATDIAFGPSVGTSYEGMARVRIEKYPEANLLLLGIPPVIF